MKNEESFVSILWSITKLLTCFTWQSSKFIVKNTPTAAGIAWQVKKEISEEIMNEILQCKKEIKEQKIINEIKSLNYKNGVKK